LAKFRYYPGFGSKTEADDPITEKDGVRYKTRNGGLVKLCEAEITKGKLNYLCKNFAIKNSNFCLRHGGVPAVANTNTLNFQTGVKSINASGRFRNVGSRLLGRIDELREDPELWSLRDDAAYITALLDTRAEAAAEGVSIDQYKKIQEIYRTCCEKKYSDDFWETFSEMGRALENVMTEFAAAKDVIELIEKRTSIVETEQRLLHQKAYTLEVDQAFSLVMQMVKIIQDNVSNAEELQGIKGGIGKLLAVYQHTIDDMIIDAEVIDGTEESGEYETYSKGVEEVRPSE